MRLCKLNLELSLIDYYSIIWALNISEMLNLGLRLASRPDPKLNVEKKVV